MFQNDYILRMIEMLGSFLQRLKQIVDEQEQKRFMDEACREHCGISLEALHSLSAETLIDMLPEAPRFLASELLYQTALYFHENASLLKSLRLLLSLYQEGTLVEMRWKRVLELSRRLSNNLTVSDYMDCAAFFLQGEAYADCEDAVFQALALSERHERKEWLKRGIALLQKAGEADETSLAFCNLSRKELMESISDLQMMYS